MKTTTYTTVTGGTLRNLLRDLAALGAFLTSVAAAACVERSHTIDADDRIAISWIAVASCIAVVPSVFGLINGVARFLKVCKHWPPEELRLAKLPWYSIFITLLPESQRENVIGDLCESYQLNVSRKDLAAANRRIAKMIDADVRQCFSFVAPRISEQNIETTIKIVDKIIHIFGFATIYIGVIFLGTLIFNMITEIGEALLLGILAFVVIVVPVVFVVLVVVALVNVLIETTYGSDRLD